jgi:hypothetical protein
MTVLIARSISELYFSSAAVGVDTDEVCPCSGLAKAKTGYKQEMRN